MEQTVNFPFCVKVSQNAMVGASRPSRRTQGTLPLPSRRALPPSPFLPSLLSFPLYLVICTKCFFRGLPQSPQPLRNTDSACP